MGQGKTFSKAGAAGAAGLQQADGALMVRTSQHEEELALVARTLTHMSYVAKKGNSTGNSIPRLPFDH